MDKEIYEEAEQIFNEMREYAPSNMINKVKK